MARQHMSTQTKTLESQNASHGLAQADITSFFGTMAGVVVGVLIALGMTGPMVRSQVADATKGLQATTASSTTADTCSGAAVAQSANSAVGGSGAGSHQVASAHGHTMPIAQVPEGGRGGGDTEWVKEFVGGFHAKTEASISNTGANSTNTIKTVNKNKTVINNTNDVKVTNNNEQTATSGDAATSKNTEGGDATSGTASNTSDASLNVTISN